MPFTPGDLMLWALALLVCVLVLAAIVNVVSGVVRRARAARPNRAADDWDSVARRLTER